MFLFELSTFACYIFSCHRSKIEINWLLQFWKNLKTSYKKWKLFIFRNFFLTDSIWTSSNAKVLCNAKSSSSNRKGRPVIKEIVYPLRILEIIKISATKGNVMPIGKKKFNHDTTCGSWSQIYEKIFPWVKPISFYFSLFDQLKHVFFWSPLDLPTLGRPQGRPALGRPRGDLDIFSYFSKNVKNWTWNLDFNYTITHIIT